MTAQQAMETTLRPGEDATFQRWCSELEKLRAMTFDELYDYAFGPAPAHVGTEASAMVDEWFEDHAR